MTPIHNHHGDDMDPEENMIRQVELAQEILVAHEAGLDFKDKAVELAELILAEHEWATKGGFNPRVPTPEMVESMRERAEREAEERGVGLDRIVLAASPDGVNIRAFVVGEDDE